MNGWTDDESERCRTNNESAAKVFCGVETKGDETRNADVVKVQSCGEADELYTVNRHDLNMAMRACVNDFKSLDCKSLNEAQCRGTLGCNYLGVINDGISCDVSDEVNNYRQTNTFELMCNYYRHKGSVGPTGDLHEIEPELWKCVRGKAFNK